MDQLDRIAVSHNASRNAIIEYSVRRLVPIITLEQEKHHQRKEVLQRIETHYAEGATLLEQMETTLGVEDLMCQKIGAVLAAYKEAVEEMEDLIEKGRRIEKFQGAQE